MWMSNDSSSSRLSFDKSEFMKDEFNVDRFVMKYKEQISLEMLRDDLGLYLKLLRSAMIELLNQDYADFVNLSSNLVGLDNHIKKLEVPLRTFREQILQVKMTFENYLSAKRSGLMRLHEVRDQKRYLLSLGTLPGCLEKLEIQLGIGDKEEDGVQRKANDDDDILERCASEYNQLTYILSHCGNGNNSKLIEHLMPRIELVRNSMQNRLHRSFIRALDDQEEVSRRSDRIAMLLRVFATIDQISVVESLFRSHLVDPTISQILNETSLNNSPHGLRGLYANVIKFIEVHCNDLLQAIRLGGGDTLKDFDFLINVVFRSIVDHLNDHLSSIFAPGNPKSFFDKYTATVEFLNQFEIICQSEKTVRKLRSSDDYKRLIGRWNIPVYFQIRYQEIGVSLESHFKTPIEVLEKSDEVSFRLAASKAVWSAVQRCWAHDVFLRVLFHRFWKLTLQLLSRYASWVKSILEDKTSIELRIVVLFYIDSSLLMEKVATIVDDLVQCRVNDMPEQIKTMLKGNMDECLNSLMQLRPLLSLYIKRRLLSSTLPHVSSVSDIPRLYRRTNRDTPTKPSSYVTSLFVPFEAFVKDDCYDVSRSYDDDVISLWLKESFSELCKEYSASTSDVLTSVQRMEESLKRLKRSSRGGNSASGDDEKIRIQLMIDVTSLGDKMNKLNVDPASVREFVQLDKLVKDAINKGKNC